jgi:hypothetical protein
MPEPQPIETTAIAEVTKTNSPLNHRLFAQIEPDIIAMALIIGGGITACHPEPYFRDTGTAILAAGLVRLKGASVATP